MGYKLEKVIEDWEIAWESKYDLIMGCDSKAIFKIAWAAGYASAVKVICDQNYRDPLDGDVEE